jgi:predicted enzyme related to lactoylglutathione lyase
MGQGGVKIAQFKDPDGNVIGIMQSLAMEWQNVGRWGSGRWVASCGRRAVFPRRHVMQVSGIEVVVQFCVDPEQAKAWYADFLGVETTPYPSPLFVLGGSTLLLAPGAPGTGRGGTGVYFTVESVDEAYKELTARGYRFNEAPYDVPVGRLVTLNDPDGNIVGLEDRSKGGLAGVGL